MRTLIIDNYDSYTFNLYQLFAEVNGELPIVVYNDRIEWDELREWEFDNIAISPGPGRPEKPKDFGICRQVIEKADVPLLGVCLGHQGLGYCYGGTIIHAPEVRHGRLSQVYHNGSPLFEGIPSPFWAVRYHSLLVGEELPDCLEKTAWTEEGLVMGLRHRDLPLWGVQFHPESLCTEYGRTLLENFRDISGRFIHNRLSRQQKQYWTRYDAVLPLPKRQLEFELCTRKLDIYPDTEQLFVHLFGEAPKAFWLDSSLVEAGLARFSFMGDGSGENSHLVRYHAPTQELMIIESDNASRRTESIFEYLQTEIDRRYCPSEDLPFDFNCGFVGYLGYELKAECGSQLGHPSALPDALFLLADRLIAIDHQEKNLYLLCLIKQGQIAQAEAWFEKIKLQLCTLKPLSAVIPKGQREPISFWLSRSYQTYLEDIQKCLHAIYEGETYQVCLTNQLHTNTVPDPLAFYRTLRRVNPAPYSAFLRFNDLAIACSSPERFLKIDRDGWVETKPIKGTSRRGQTVVEDKFLCESLRNSEKERSENLMIVDLLRNDLGKVCQVGSIHVPKLMAVETYATVHQLVSTIRGRLRGDTNALDCIRHAFPGGSMTGAPKIRTLEMIDRLEQEARGVYSGAIGFLGLNGTTDLNIAIRTAVLTPNTLSIGVGGGIVALSNPDQEFQEMLLKAQALIQAVLLTVCGEDTPHLYRILGTKEHFADNLVN